MKFTLGFKITLPIFDEMPRHGRYIHSNVFAINYMVFFENQVTAAPDCFMFQAVGVNFFSNQTEEFRSRVILISKLAYFQFVSQRNFEFCICSSDYLCYKEAI